MSKTELRVTAGVAPGVDEGAPGEAALGRALTAIHRVLPRLDDPERGEAVQTLLARIASDIAAARAAHRESLDRWQSAALAPEIVALISAAVAMVVNRPHRVVGMKAAETTGSWGSAWAIEGRFQHYSSHKVR